MRQGVASWRANGAAPASGPLSVVVLDCGVKYGILRRLRAAGCASKVVPASTTAEQIAAIEARRAAAVQRPRRPRAVTNVVRRSAS